MNRERLPLAGALFKELIDLRHILSLLLASALLLSLLNACQQPSITESDPLPSPAVDEPSVKELADAVLPYTGRDKALETEVLDAGAVAVYLENAYNLDTETCADAAIIRGAGMSAFEIAILRFSGEDAAKDSSDLLKDYLHTREGDFTGYAPAEADMAADGHIQQEGAWLGLFICPDPEGAEDAFRRALNGDELSSPTLEPVVETPPSITDMESLKDALIFRYRNELTELGDYRVSMFASTESFPQFVEATYGIPADQLADGFVIDDLGGAPFELIVLRMVDSDASVQYFSTLSDYKNALKERFVEQDDEGHRIITAENEEPYMLVSQSSTMQYSEFLALLICRDPDAAKAFKTDLNSLHRTENSSEVTESAPVVSRSSEGVPAFSEVNWKLPEGEPDPDYPDRIRFTPPNKEDMSIYDTSAILAAWTTDDPSPLSDYDRTIYDAAEAVLDEILTGGMSSYDKEVAIYAWVVQHVSYDHTPTDILEETDRDAFGPYGGLVNHACVCLGYSSTFQLLADMAGLECITVVGAGSSSEEDHAWNMVRLNGNWYCLDTTWDAGYLIPGDESGWTWRFFNVTSDYMARSNHQWDYANTPEAVTEGHGQS